MGPQLVDIDLIRDAAELIRPHAVRTPLLASPWPGLWLKPENLQPIGAFKIRGAVAAISRLDPAVRARGVLAHSSGNHAQAVAYTARAFGIDAYIVIPDNAPARKIQATRDLGATVELVPVEQRFSRPAELAEQTGKAMIPPFDNPDVISGQGTVGLEIAIDMPDVNTVLVEPELAGDAAESFAAGRRIPWTSALTARTMADGLRTFSVGELPWEHIRTQVHDIITVTEDEIADATRRLLLQARLVAEPSGAVAAAAYLHHGSQLPGGRTVAVVSGGNIDPAVLRALLVDA